MKRTLSLLAIVLMAISVSAQEAWLWPIQGQKAGAGILYRPQDYIEKEHNFGNLFIEAPVGTPVVCPVDGTVTFCNLTGLMSLSNSVTCGFDKSYAECVEELRSDMQRRGIGERYISVGLSINVGGGKSVHIDGLRMDRALKTGVRVKRGDVIGTVGYAYKAVSVPHIMLSVDQRGTADPMSPFGLKSTFKAPVAVKPKEVLTRAEAESDYRRMASSVREIYPSLTDLMTLEEYDAFVEEQVKSLPERISRRKFSQMLTLFNERVHDSHLYIQHSVPSTGQNMYTPIYFAMLGGKCLATMTTRQYEAYAGREIVKIDGRPAAEVCALTRRNSSSYDAQVQSVQDYNQAYWPGIDYALENAPQKKGDKITLDFADGEHLVADLIERMNYCREFADSWNAPRRINMRQGAPYEARMLNDSTLYIGLSHFNLSEVETDSVLWHIRQAEVRHTPYLIFDVRNNPGGQSEVMERITRALMGKTPDRPHVSYQMANAARFQSPISNYPAGEDIVGWLHPVEGRQGIYSERIERHFELDPEGYNGRLYVLTDSRSASASAFLAGCIKRNARGAIVGRETMSAYHTETCTKFAWVDLPNSQFGIKIPVVRDVVDETVSDRLPAGRGVMPDYDIPMSYEEYTYAGDYILDRTLQLIAEGIGSPFPGPFPKGAGR